MKSDGPLETFLAHTEGQGRLRIYIYRDPPAADNVAVRGWCFVVDKEGVSIGDWTPIYDGWAETFAEICLYPAEYNPEPLHWLDTVSGVTYSLDDIKKMIRS